MDRAICIKAFAKNIWNESITRYLCYFHKFLVQAYLNEHFWTFEDICVVSGFVCVALIGFFFIIKPEPLFGETLIEIKCAVAKQTKIGQFFFIQNILPATIFYLRQKEYLKIHFEFSFGININVIYSNSA